MTDVGRILRNRARCKKCGDIIESKHRHDHVACSCGEIAVDGGLAYLRRTFNRPENLEEMAEHGE